MTDHKTKQILIDNTVVSSSSEKDMYQFLENAELNVQQVTYFKLLFCQSFPTPFLIWQNVPVSLREPHENSKNMQVGNTFAVPSMLFPMLSPPCMNSNRIAPNMAESDSLNETVSPLRPHTRRYWIRYLHTSARLLSFAVFILTGRGDLKEWLLILNHPFK